MAIKLENGLYEHRIWISFICKDIIGTGETKGAAIADAKAKKAEYLKVGLQPTANEVKSPGNEFYKDSRGQQWLPEYKADRKVTTFARPELLETIKENLKK